MKLENEKKESYSLRILFAVIIAVGALLSLILGDYIFIREGVPLINEVLLYSIPFLYLYLSYVSMKKLGLLSSHCFKENLERLSTLKTLLVGFASMIIALTLSVFTNVIPHLEMERPDNFMKVLIGLIALSLCIGFFEEGVFRGVLLRLLFKDKTKKSLWFAVTVSSILFGLIHLGNLTVAKARPIAVTAQVIYAIFLGVLFSAIYIKYKSFIGVSLFHALIDFISFVPRLYEKAPESKPVIMPDITLITGLQTIAVLLPALVIGIIILIRYSKKNLE